MQLVSNKFGWPFYQNIFCNFFDLSFSFKGTALDTRIIYTTLSFLRMNRRERERERQRERKREIEREIEEKAGIVYSSCQVVVSFRFCMEKINLIFRSRRKVSVGLIVEYAPSVTLTASRSKLMEGDTATFNCQVVE